MVSKRLIFATLIMLSTFALSCKKEKKDDPKPKITSKADKIIGDFTGTYSLVYKDYPEYNSLMEAVGEFTKIDDNNVKLSLRLSDDEIDVNGFMNFTTESESNGEIIIRLSELSQSYIDIDFPINTKGSFNTNTKSFNLSHNGKDIDGDDFSSKLIGIVTTKIGGGNISGNNNALNVNGSNFTNDSESMCFYNSSTETFDIIGYFKNGSESWDVRFKFNNSSSPSNGTYSAKNQALATEGQSMDSFLGTNGVSISISNIENTYYFPVSGSVNVSDVGGKKRVSFTGLSFKKYTPAQNFGFQEAGGSNWTVSSTVTCP